MSTGSRGSRGLSWLLWLAGAALALTSLWPLAPRASAATVAIYRATISNVTDASFTISWVTSVPSDGYVRYGTAASQLSSRAEDDRGASYVGYTHYVTASAGVHASTRYYFNVVSGDATADRDFQNATTVLTGQTLGSPPGTSPNNLTGVVLKSDRMTPADGAIVYVYLVRYQATAAQPASAKLSKLTDGAGAFSVDVSKAREAAATNQGQPYYTYATSGDTACYQVDGGPNNWLVDSSQCVDTKYTSAGSNPEPRQLQLPNPDPSTPTPTPTLTVSPTRTPAPAGGTATPGPASPTAVSTPSPLPAALPTPLATPTPAAEPSPTKPVAPTATPTPPPPSPTPQPTATPTQAGILRPPPPVSALRPTGNPAAGFAQRAAPTALAPTSTPPARPTPVADTASASPAPEYAPPVVVALIGAGVVLVAAGLGLVTVGVVTGLRRRPV